MFGYRGRISNFIFLEIVFSRDNGYAWFTLCDVLNDNGELYSLFHIERVLGSWSFDVLFLRSFIRWWRRTNA